MKLTKDQIRLISIRFERLFERWERELQAVEDLGLSNFERSMKNIDKIFETLKI